MKRKLTINFILVATLMFLSGGCNMLKQSVVTEKSDPKETVIKAFEKLKEVKFFIAKESIDDKPAFTYSYIAPAKFRRTSESKDGDDLIVINADSYLTFKDGNYRQARNSEKDSKGNHIIYINLLPNGENIISKLSQLKDVQFKQKQTVEDQEGLLYTGKIKDNEFSVIVSTDTGLPIQVKSKPSREVVTTYDYTTEPKIEAPTNVNGNY